MSYDEVLAADIELIERFGWMIQYVTGPVPWAYTIGLTAGFAHPELTVVGLDYRQSMDLLNDLGEQVRAGTRLRPGTSWTDTGPVELVEVHRDHWQTDHFANWWVVTDEMEVPMETEPRALQVLASDPEVSRLDQPLPVAR
jgi:hypothetical protein